MRDWDAKGAKKLEINRGDFLVEGFVSRKGAKVWDINPQRVYLLAVFLSIPGLRNGVKELCVLCGYLCALCVHSLIIRTQRSAESAESTLFVFASYAALRETQLVARNLKLLCALCGYSVHFASNHLLL